MTVTSDNELFLVLWKEAEISLTKYVVSLVGRGSIADEIVQDVAFICFRRLSSFQRGRNFTAWALGVARIEVFTHRRRHILAPISEFSELEAVMGDPDEFIQQQNLERGSALQQCIEKLTNQQKQLLELHYGRSHNYDEMAAILHIQICTITVALSRVRGLLRNCINKFVSQADNL